MPAAGRKSCAGAVRQVNGEDLALSCHATMRMAKENSIFQEAKLASG